MFISSVGCWCTHNALLILILKYAAMLIILQDTHFRWQRCRCPPSHSHTPICQCIWQKSIYILGLYKCAIFSLTLFNPYNTHSHIVSCHSMFYWFTFILPTSITKSKAICLNCKLCRKDLLSKPSFKDIFHMYFQFVCSQANVQNSSK